MGVITITDVDYGHIFGPFPTHVSPADPAYLIGMLTNDKRPEGFMLKMDPSLRREGLRVVDWLPYIQPARDSEEQNMEAYLKEGQVYFRALRIIKAGEEMLVWYSKDFAQLLNIPELPRNNDREHYICPRCGDTFEYPYPLRAHIKFKCSFVLQNFSPNKAFLPHADFKNALICSNGDRAFRSFRPFNPRPCTDTGRSASPKDIQLNGLDFSRSAMQSVGVSHSLVGLDFSKSRNNSGVDYSKSTNEHSPVSVDISYQADSIRAAHCSPSSTLASPASSSSSKSERSSSVDLSPPAGKLHSGAEFAQSFKLFAESRKRGTSPPLSPRKGSPGGDRSPASSPKIPRLQGEPKAELLSPGRITTAATVDRSPGRSPSSLKDGPGEVTSAFRKVERTSTPETDRPNSGGSSTRAEDNASLSPVDGSRGPVTAAAAAALPPTLHVPPLSRFALPVAPPTSSSSAAVHGLPSAMPGPLMGLYMPRLPVGPPPSPLGLPGIGVGVTAGPLHAVSAHHPAFAAADQIPPGLLEMCRAAIPSIGPLTESFANIRNGEGPGIPLKPGMFLGERSGGHPSLSGVGGLGPAAVPFLKTNNPMVEKILQSTSPALMASALSPISMSQNWCAKCNATFRMTSDLVYHMRSHHKREFDPMKRKREEKLKCTICNEMFRERHHLTRHMSSHA